MHGISPKFTSETCVKLRLHRWLTSTPSLDPHQKHTVLDSIIGAGVHGSHAAKFSLLDCLAYLALDFIAFIFPDMVRVIDRGQLI